MSEYSTDYIPQALGERFYTHPVELTKIPTVLPARGRLYFYKYLKRLLKRVQEEVSET